MALSLTIGGVTTASNLKVRVTDRASVLDALEERVSWQERDIAVDAFKVFLAPQAECLLAPF